MITAGHGSADLGRLAQLADHLAEEFGILVADADEIVAIVYDAYTEAMTVPSIAMLITEDGLLRDYDVDLASILTMLIADPRLLGEPVVQMDSIAA